MKKILAFLLAVLVCVSLLAACGDDSSSDSSSGSSSGSGSTESANTQTWGDITVYVPDGMTLEGGNGTFDPDDPKTLWLREGNGGMNYIKVQLVDSAADAQNNIDMTKSMNEEYSPRDLTWTGPNGISWKGVMYEASGYLCVSLYAETNGKVYYVISAGYDPAAGGPYTSVLNSLQ